MNRKMKLGLAGIALASNLAFTDISSALTPLPPIPPSGTYVSLSSSQTNSNNLIEYSEIDEKSKFRGFLYGTCLIIVLGFGAHAVYSEFRKN